DRRGTPRRRRALAPGRRRTRRAGPGWLRERRRGRAGRVGARGAPGRAAWLMAERARVDITSIAAGGDGVARVDGLVVFVPRTAPGDVAEIEFTLHGRLARGRLLSLERSSTSRVEPPCPHYVADRCGGCQLQHLDYQAQLDAKSQLVADAMARIGR